METYGKSLRRALFLLSSLTFSWAYSQAYLDGRAVLELMNASRYAEAYALARKEPERYAQWTAFLMARALLPESAGLNSFEATARGAEYACRHASVNKESEAFCYHLLRFLLQWKDWDPRASRALSQVSVPSLSLAEIKGRVTRLAQEGVPFAAFRDVQNSETGLKELVRKHPYSLGGASAAGHLSLLLWEKERYAEAVSWALKVAGFSGTPGGVLAYGEYHGIGVKRDPQAACRRSLFWAKRGSSGPALYTLALCHMEGAGGFPKDLPLAYGLLWVGKEYSRYPHFIIRIMKLERVLTPEQLREGRRRGAEFVYQ